MKIALIGYGKMGKMIEELAVSNGHLIVAKISPHEIEKAITKESIGKADVCIDFSHPSCALENIKQATALGKNIIMGTTGWYESLDLVKSLVESSGVGFLYSPNFSLGVALFLEIVKAAAALIAPFETYDVGGFEMHHNQKVDTPSGTAKAIVQKLLAKNLRKKGVIYDTFSGKIPEDQISFPSVRLGSIPGTHTVTFDSSADTITLTHAARNRTGFADGAIRAAEWIQGKSGFFTIEDMLLPTESGV